MTGTRDVTRHNRESWNAVAKARRANCPPPEFFAGGGSTLDAEETAAVGPVAGLRLLNLQCSSGNEALSWAAKGAAVTGVDISDVAIAIATEQATAAGLDVTFVAADVYDLPSDLQDGSFDVVYSSHGVVCWLPDLDEWARVIVRALRPGGRFVLDEHHPLWEVLSVGPDGLEVTGNYLASGTPNPPAPFDPLRAVHAGAEPIEMDGTTFTWSLGHIVSALARAGMRIRTLEERPIEEMYLSGRPEGQRTPREGHVAARIPAAYLLVATRD